MANPKPITLVSGANPNPDLAPQPFVVVGGVPAGEVSSGDISDATAVGVSVLTAASQAAARTAIGAGTGNGTSNLALGTTASTAAAGNHTHTFTALTGTVAGLTGANLQAILLDIVAQLATKADATP